MEKSLLEVELVKARHRQKALNELLNDSSARLKCYEKGMPSMFARQKAFHERQLKALKLVDSEIAELEKSSGALPLK